jgi:hypothetical protein
MGCPWRVSVRACRALGGPDCLDRAVTASRADRAVTLGQGTWSGPEGASCARGRIGGLDRAEQACRTGQTVSQAAGARVVPVRASRAVDRCTGGRRTEAPSGAGSTICLPGTTSGCPEAARGAGVGRARLDRTEVRVRACNAVARLPRPDVCPVCPSCASAWVGSCKRAVIARRAGQAVRGLGPSSHSSVCP